MARWGSSFRLFEIHLKSKLDLDFFDVAVISFFYQFTLYVSLRLARQGFTVGELGLVAQGATALFMELVNITISKVCAKFFINNTSLFLSNYFSS